MLLSCVLGAAFMVRFLVALTLDEKKNAVRSTRFTVPDYTTLQIRRCLALHIAGQRQILRPISPLESSESLLLSPTTAAGGDGKPRLARCMC